MEHLQLTEGKQGSRFVTLGCKYICLLDDPADINLAKLEASLAEFEKTEVIVKSPTSQNIKHQQLKVENPGTALYKFI